MNLKKMERLTERSMQSTKVKHELWLSCEKSGVCDQTQIMEPQLLAANVIGQNHQNVGQRSTWAEEALSVVQTMRGGAGQEEGG